MLLAENRCLRKVKPSHAARGWGQMKTWEAQIYCSNTESEPRVTSVHPIANIVRVEGLEENAGYSAHACPGQRSARCPHRSTHCLCGDGLGLRWGGTMASGASAPDATRILVSHKY